MGSQFFSFILGPLTFIPFPILSLGAHVDVMIFFPSGDHFTSVESGASNLAISFLSLTDHISMLPRKFPNPVQIKNSGSFVAVNKPYSCKLTCQHQNVSLRIKDSHVSGPRPEVEHLLALGIVERGLSRHIAVDDSEFSLGGTPLVGVDRTLFGQ